MYSLFDRHISFSLSMPITFEIVHMCIYTQCSCLLSVKLQPQVFSFGSHICSFTSMITYIFLFERCIPRNYILYSSCMYICMYVCACMIVHLSECMQWCIQACMYAWIYICVCNNVLSPLVSLHLQQWFCKI